MISFIQTRCHQNTHVTILALVRRSMAIGDSYVQIFYIIIDIMTCYKATTANPRTRSVKIYHAIFPKIRSSQASEIRYPETSADRVHD